MSSQRSRILLAVVAAIACLAPLSGLAITPYSQDFETLIQTDTSALANDGWVVYGNVFSPTGTYLYGYGTFPAPNDGFAFCQIDLLQGGVDQGLQQLVVFSDYNNADHAAGNTIESNVFHEQSILAGDVGTTWKFSFDAKLGNITGSSTATAFIKTLNPAAGWATTNYVFLDMTAISPDWYRYEISLPIDASLAGQLIQFGYANRATLYEGSGIFYDNLVWEQVTTGTPVPDASAIAGAVLGQNYPNPFNPVTRIDFSLEKAGVVDLAIYDVAGRRIRTLESGSLDAGDHHVTWNGLTDAGVRAASGRYDYVLTTESGRTARSMVLVK